VLKTLFGKPPSTARKNPADGLNHHDLNDTEKVLSSRLMRINHTGEVCAQGLYQGQALTAKLPNVKDSMEQAAKEENDHLIWCEDRIKELNGQTSYLNPFWFFGSYFMGAAAGLLGDKWSLGFVAETEKQVEKHLDSHLLKISENDLKSRAIIRQMREDEIKHAKNAIDGGGVALPIIIKKIMKSTAGIMTRTVYWV
jgi:ubiquinone biosynthesis monooxygenase Coq7